MILLNLQLLVVNKYFNLKHRYKDKFVYLETKKLNNHKLKKD